MSTPANQDPEPTSKGFESNLSQSAEPVTLAGQTGNYDFEELYRQYKNKVYSTAYRYTGNRADAEDVTQDVFVKVYKKLSGFRGEASVSTWIYRIAVNTCLDYLRRRKRETAISIDDCPEPSVGPTGIGRLVESMIPKLPDASRRVFVLYDIQGLKHCEIATSLGITEGASKSLLHRARSQMRKMLGPYVKGWNH